MIELWLIFKAYLRLLLTRFQQTILRQKQPWWLSQTRYFKKGDEIEANDGTRGRVWRVYVKITTGKPTACSVIWDGRYQGEKVTAVVSVIDKSPKFNPVIRKAQQ